MNNKLNLYTAVRLIKRLVLLICGVLAIGLLMIFLGDNITTEVYTKMFMDVSPAYLILVICEATELIIKLFTKR